MSEIVSELDHWQTLVSGLLAIVAAGASIWMIKRQIAQVEKHEKNRLERRFVAVRAVLPLTLDALAEYAEKMIVELSRVLITFSYVGEGPAPPSFAPPTRSADLETRLGEAIESIGQPNVIALLSGMVREMQILSARVASLSGETRGERNAAPGLTFQDAVFLAAKLHAMAVSLFGFARGDDATGPVRIEWDRVVAPLLAADVREDRFPDLYQTIERQMNSARPLWQYEK